MFDMFGMMGKIGEAQKRMKIVKDRLKTIVLTESELDGVVEIDITAGREVKAIRTSAEFYEKYSAEERMEIMAEAMNNALIRAEARNKEEIRKALEGLVPNIPGLGIDMNNLPFTL